MRLLRTVVTLIATIWWFSGSSQLVLGGNITWECQGANQYNITFTLYRDCFGSPGEAPSANVLFYPSGCGDIPFSGDLDFVSAVEISDLCPTELPNSSCGGIGATPGTMQVTYSGVVTLNSGCVWNVFWNAWDWSLLFENMDPVFLQDAYIQATIDTSQPCGNSPDVISSPAAPQVPYLCVGTPYVHNAFMSLPAGFSCSYAFTSIETTGGTANNPVAVSGYAVPAGMTINPLTGIINWTPSAVGYYSVSVQMNINNGANAVGTMYENMTFVVRDCAPTNTEFTSPEVTSVGTDPILTGTNNLAVCVGDSLNFTVEADNPEVFRGITLSYTNIPALPFTFTQSGVNPAIGTFKLLVTPAMITAPGTPYVLQIHAVDDACPNPDTDDIVVNITVNPNISFATQDTTICFGQSVNLVASGLNTNNYTWSVIGSGDNSPAPSNSVSSQSVTPDFTTSYKVTVPSVPASCVSTDTVTVTVALTDLTFATNSESCGNVNGSIDMTVLGDGSGNYSYDWTGAGTVDGQEDQSNLNGGVGINYSVIVTDLTYNCSLNETVGVSELPPPAVTLSPDVTICNGGNTTLSFDFTAGQSPFDIDFTVSPANPVPADAVAVATDPYNVVVSPTQTTTYTVVSVTDGFGCTSNINQSIIVTVRNSVTSSFLPENAICVGSNLVLDIDHSQAGTYSVYYSINGVSQPLPVIVADNAVFDVPDPATNGTFIYDIDSVSYNDAPLPACPSNDAANGSISVVVNPLPTAVLSGDAAICSGDCYNQTITLTGTGPWTVGYTKGGVAQPALVIPAAAAPYNYTWNVCPATTAIYCLTSVQDANCSNTVVGECATITVNSFPVVNYTISNLQLCEGTCTNLNITVAPAGAFTAVFTETPDDPGFTNPTNVNTPFTIPICPTSDTSYKLDSVYYNGTPQCATVVNQTLQVDVNGTIAVTAADTICNNTGLQYQVQYTITGGSLPYDELPGGTGGTFNVAGDVYTSFAINSGTAGGSWTFSDSHDCNSVVMNMGAYSCPVLTNAGTMNLTPQVICGTAANPGQATGVWNNNGFLDGNDDQMFILHTVANNTIGTVVATDCNDANFGDADSPLTFGAVTGNGTGVIVNGTTYYISSVAGDGSGLGVGGCVNLAAANVQISPGQPVTWYQKPVVVFTAGSTELCPGQCTTLHATVTPAQPFSIQFSESPSDPALGLSVGQNSPFDYNICPLVTTTYTLDSVFVTAAPQCATVVNQSITVNVNSNISVASTDTICTCSGSQYQVVYTLSGGELPYDEDPTGVNGTFDVTGTIFTTDLINSGSGAGPWSFSDVNNCNVINKSINPYSCPVITNAGTMSLAPLAICGGITIPNTGTGVFNNNAVTDCNDQQMFILHTTPNSTQGVVVATDCDDSVFGDADSPLTFGAVTGNGTGVIVSGTTYYISSVAGDDSGSGAGGCVNLAAPNVKISAGQPVTWFQASTATLEAVGDTFACQGGTVTLKVTFTGQSPWSFIYTKNGVAQPSINVIPANNPYIFTVNSSGVYCLQSVTNSPANCAGTVSGCVTVVINPLPTASFDGNGTTCAGTNYCFDVDLTGTAPWTFTVNDPDAINDVVAAVNTDPYSYCVGQAGPYQIVTITDGNGCVNNVASTAVDLVVNPLPTVQWTFPSDTSFCAGSCIDLTIANTGASTFDVNINSPDPNITSATLQNIGQIHTITVCEPGDYQLIDVTDSNGCVSANGDLIHVDEIALPIANAGNDLDQCVGLPLQIGTASIAGQTYSWSPAAGIPLAQQQNAQPNVTLNAAGSYTYTVTASIAQCDVTDQMILNIHDLPVVDITALDDSICFAACTDLAATGADNYVWNNSTSITTALNLPDVTVCPSVSETFTVTGSETHNAIQCQSTATIDIVVGAAMSVVEDYSDELCYLQCNGFANFQPSGGFAPYFVNGDPSLNWTNLCAGLYDYTLTDAQGCQLDSSFTIIERPEEIIDLVTPTNPICFGDATGSIEVTDASGTSYVLNAPGTLPDILDNVPPFIFTDLVPGDYIISMAVTLPSGLQCADTTLVTLVSLSPEVTIDIPWTSQQSCYGDEVCFEANVQGGFGGLVTHWNTCADANACEISSSNPFCLILTQDTTLYVFGTDQNQCPTDTLQMSASLFPDISLLLQGGADSVEVCEYSCIDLFTQVSGGNGNIFVDWYEIPVDNSPFATADTITICPFYSSPFVYYYVIANDGCSSPETDTLKVIVHDSPEVVLTADTLEACYPDSISFQYELNPTFTDNHSCTWRPGNGLSYNYCGDTTFIYTHAGTYYPSITITSEYGCVGGDTLIDPVVIHGYPEMDFTWSPQPVDVLHLEVQFQSLTQGADSIRWNFYNAGTSTGLYPTWTFPDVETTHPFQICLEGISEFGCKDTLCQDVYIESVLQVFVPNTFTPDGDGINDVFLPSVKGVKPKTYKLWVFNRWGDPIFYTEDPEKAWTGGADDGLYYIQDGSYPWRIECEAVQDGRIEVYEGHVTILR